MKSHETPSVPRSLDVFHKIKAQKLCAHEGSLFRSEDTQSDTENEVISQLLFKPPTAMQLQQERLLKEF